MPNIPYPLSATPYLLHTADMGWGWMDTMLDANARLLSNYYLMIHTSFGLPDLARSRGALTSTPPSTRVPCLFVVRVAARPHNEDVGITMGCSTLCTEYSVPTRPSAPEPPAYGKHTGLFSAAYSMALEIPTEHANPRQASNHPFTGNGNARGTTGNRFARVKQARFRR